MIEHETLNRISRLEETLRLCAVELTYVNDILDPCEKLHQTSEGKACIVLAEYLLGPMSTWPPNDTVRDAQDIVRGLPETLR